MEDAKVEVSDIGDGKLLVRLEFEKRPGSILPNKVAEKLKTLAEVDVRIGTRRGKVTANLVLQGKDGDNMPNAEEFADSLKEALAE
ncbi:hypothetical protein MLD38_032341 [Melastoma candidum]|uniref:Uncharacterized protein n=1 Tax=Melastoma candidum TaxID=119954 RepID=A0ACB9M7L3_9MYRT|nr:hypothetical protein MLD38_032341 [Melastoma candidum]